MGITTITISMATRNSADRLETSGLRATKARSLILALIDRQGHLSPEEMLSAFASDKVDMSQATLYQNLVHLHRAGVVRKFLDSQGIARYDSNMHDHDHLICSKCGAMVDLEPIDRQALSIKAPLGWTVQDVTIEIKGLCPGCQEQN